MKTRDIHVKALFGSDIQCVIPLFQRHYVWDREDQWAPLWEDMREKANQRLSEPQRQQFTHFTGAIVIQQNLTSTNEVQTYEIIDGQQRLTTFQIILCALRDICKSYQSDQFEKIKAEADRYVRNQGMLLDSDDERYKLVPTEFDRSAFISLVDQRVDDSSGRIRETYNYFKDKIEWYVDRDREKMLALLNTVLNDFGFVEILLDVSDEPERIFESLNARAKSLLQFDLLRNNLFLRARIEENRDRLYEDYWKHFELPYWEQEINVGRSKVILSERFFEHFIMAKTGMDNVRPLFNVYQRNLTKNNSVQDELSELKKYSEVYQYLRDCAPDSDIELAMRLFEVFKIATLYPFLLFIINELGVSGPDFSRVLHVLESFTMRRMLCLRLTATKSYTQFFSRLIGQLKGKRFNLEEFIDMLSNEKAKASVWPTNSEVETSLAFGVSRYGAPKNVIRYILYRIECIKRKENRFLETDELVFDNKLSLEHVMPEAWQKTWSLPLSLSSDGEPSSNDAIYFKDLFTPEYKRMNREWETNPFKDGLADESYETAYQCAKQRIEVLQSIGNLTLVTGKLNSALSNRSFSDKRSSLSKNSVLILNKEICDQDVWDSECIHDRTADLFTYFCKIWPSPDDFAKDSPYRLDTPVDEPQETEPTVVTRSLDTPVDEPQETEPIVVTRSKANQKNNPLGRLRVTMSNRDVISQPKGVDTYCEILELFELSRVNAIEPRIVSDAPFPNGRHRQIGDYYVNTNNGAPVQKRILERIAETLGIQLHVETIPK